MEDGQRDLRNNVLGRHKVDVVDMPHILQLYVPLCELLRSKIETTGLMGDVIVLTEDAAETTAAEEDATTSVVTLEAGLFSKVRRNGVNFDGLSADKTDARLLVPIHAAQSWAKVAIAQMCICLRSFARGIRGRYQLVARDIVVEKVWWGEVELAEL